VFDPIAGSIKVKLSIPRKLLTGQYHNIEDLLTDIEDPFSAGSLPALLFAIPCATLALIPAMMEMGSLYFRRNIYDVARDVGATIPTFADLRDALLRERMSETEHDWWLGSAGFSQANIDIIKELYFDIPTPSDLVRMAVREVFDPVVVERFGQMEDFPLDFAKWGKQTGISDFWAHAHWAAHWDLPSAQQGFAMFHRDVIAEDDLKLLLRVLDVMPFWRDRLIKIAYRVISRIDIRRMYNTGVVGRDKVLRVYKDMGYRPEDAEFLTEYVVRAAGGVGKDVPRETITGAYRGRLILRDEAADALRELGFTDDQVDFFLGMADLQVEQENARLAEDIFEADFKSGAATEAQTRSALAYLGIPEARIELLIGLWRRQAAKRTAGLATSQLQRLYHEGFINEATLRERLKALGYNDTDITLLVQISSPEAAAADRQLTLAQAREAFHEGFIDTAEFTRRLGAMGYPPEDISILLDLAQPAEIVEVKALSVSQLQRAFRQGIINEDELRTSLAERGYSPDAVDALVELAQPAVAVRARELTLSQLQSAFRQGIIDEGRLRSRLTELGYAADAVDVLVKLAQPPEVAQAKVLSVSQLQRALRQGLLSEAEVQTQLTGLGYSAGAVPVLIALARPEELVKERDLTVAQNQKAFREGLISEDVLRRRLTDMGFSALDVEILVYLALPEVS
jgi:SOS response regulatory protein OraA/RecX